MGSLMGTCRYDALELLTSCALALLGTWGTASKSACCCPLWYYWGSCPELHCACGPTVPEEGADSQQMLAV